VPSLAFLCLLLGIQIAVISAVAALAKLLSTREMSSFQWAAGALNR